MKGYKEVKFNIVFAFTEEEADWLKDYMQNAAEGWKGDEPKHCKEKRKRLFEELDKALKEA